MEAVRDWGDKVFADKFHWGSISLRFISKIVKNLFLARKCNTTMRNNLYAVNQCHALILKRLWWEINVWWIKINSLTGYIWISNSKAKKKPRITKYFLGKYEKLIHKKQKEDWVANSIDLQRLITLKQYHYRNIDNTLMVTKNIKVR